MIKVHMHKAYVYMHRYCEELIPCQGICRSSYFLNTNSLSCIFFSLFTEFLVCLLWFKNLLSKQTENSVNKLKKTWDKELKYPGETRYPEP